ncbi:MAG TPA: hypothetical protein VNN20_17005 [Thermodesulfobacteriota bacterium]|nr:hypothetical protein [Thermodesulfobacteriota bacterium]
MKNKIMRGARQNNPMSLHKSKNGEEIRNEAGVLSLILAPILMIALFLAGLLFQYLSFSTPAHIKELKGRGKAQTYNTPYDEVFQAAIEIINENGLAIVESDEEKAYIIATEGPDFLNEGRVVALFFSTKPERSGTHVEVISKYMALPPLKELLFSRNDASQILTDLDKKLEISNGYK